MEITQRIVSFKGPSGLCVWKILSHVVVFAQVILVQLSTICQSTSANVI